VSHSVRRHLRLDIEAYDATIRGFIPGYEEMIATAADTVAAGRPRHVLDLGAGTGALAAAVLARTGGTLVELVDVDEEMLDQARVRLSAFGGRTRFTRGSFHDPLPPSDAVMASLALHHVPTLGAKAELFARIRRSLPEGGVFVNADVTMPRTDPERAAAYDGWASHLVANGCTRSEAFDHFQAWSDEDTYFPLDEELTALVDAGFTAACVWQEGVSTVLVGTRR
jgi:ubiquinone/menaquinone biosynthesis C-methylase UbiE